MFKRVAQFIAILSFSMLVVTGVLQICIGMPTNSSVTSTKIKLSPFRPNTAQHTDVGLHWEKGKQLQQHVDDRTLEKPEESDAKPSNNKDNLSFPLLADLLHKHITFSLFSTLYNNQRFAHQSDILITCYDSERFIFHQHFRI